MANPLYSAGIRTLNSPAVVAPTPDPNELTPEEIAEFDAMEKAAMAGQAAPVSAPVPAPAPVSAPAPAPVAEPTPAPVVAAAPVPEPAANPDELTPAEEAEFDALEAAEKAAHPEPASDNIAEALTAEELAEMAVKDPTFDMRNEFIQNVPPRANNATLAESQKYNLLLKKFADADNILRERGFKWEDRPTLGAVGSSVRGFVEGVGKYAAPFIKGAGQVLWDTENQDFSETQRGIAEAGAASEASVGGLVDLGRNIKDKFNRKIGISKPLHEWTDDDKVKAFTDKLRRGEASDKVLKGQGPFMQSIGEHVIADLEAKGLPIRPEEVAAKSMGDPVALWAFGTAMKGIGGLTPRFVRTGIAKTEALAADVLTKGVGGAIKGASETARVISNVTAKTAPVVTPIIGVVKGAGMGGLPGAIGGFYTGKALGAGIAKTARTTAKVAEQGTKFGEQVAGSAPMVSDYAQLVRSTAQAVPGMVSATGEGLLFDVGLAAISSETPAETRGAIGVGTAFGMMGGMAHLGKKIVSGQYLAPRAYGIDKPVPTSRQALDAFVAMHNEAWALKTPQERANINATRKFMEEAIGKEAKDADFFVGKDKEAVKAALLSAKDADGKPLLSEAYAEDLASAGGFFMAELPGKDGKLRKVIIVQDVAAAPHESFHGVQDVLGEKANRVLDQIIMDSYGTDIDQIGHNYTSEFGKIPEGKTWEEVLLTKSGWGRVELIDKMTRELTESNEKQGNPPNPELITRLVMQEIARLEAEKGGDPREVWNGELSAEEAKTVANRYILREIAAETFDTVFKSKGAALKEGNTLPAKFARVVSALISGLGGNPFDTAFSERQGIQMRPEVVKAVTEAARGQLPAKPGEPIVTPKTPPSSPVGRPGAPGKGIPATPEQIEEAAAEARQVAAAAPDVVEPGKSASPRELLGTVAEAIASRFGIKLNYRSAADAAVGGEPAGSPMSNRSARRAVVEAFRTMPEAARALWEKNFFPERVVLTKGGKYQISGWAPEVFAANAHKVAKALIDARQGDLAPYPLDPTTGSFTQEGWQRLYEDTQTFVENQLAGRTGSGEELVVPRTVVDAGGYKPPVTGEAKPLEQGTADFINMLFNFRIPDTPRIIAGKRPLNIVGQEVSEATIPGRTKAVPGRDLFGGQEAVAQDIVGREIKEVNPVRGAIEAALGNQMPSFNDVRQNLNLEHINDVTVTPEQPQFRGNTLTLSAGMQAPRGKGYAADEMWLGRGKLNEAPLGHKKWAEKNFPEGEFDPTKPQLDPYERAQTAGYLRVLKGMGTLMVDPSTKYPTWDKVPREFKSALESRAVDQDLRVTFDGREVIKKFRPGDGDAQFQPAKKKLPNSAGDTDFDVTHLSSKFGLTSVKPKFFGKGKATATDLRGEPKSFFFLKGSKFGQDSPLFENAGLEEYQGVVNGSDLYDLRKGKDDPLNWRGTVNRSSADAAVRKAGYSGIILDTADGRKVVAMFKPTDVTQGGAQMAPPKNLTPVEQKWWDQMKVNGETLQFPEIPGFDHWGRIEQQHPELIAHIEELAHKNFLEIKHGPYTQMDRRPYTPARMKERAKQEREQPDEPDPYDNYYGDQPEGGAQMQAPSEPASIAEDYAKKAGITYRPSTGLKKPDEALMKDLADFYEEAKSTPDDPAVKASYDALAAETIEQFHAIEAAGYTIEPFTGKGEPYASSADMIKDVNENKHLFYLATDKAFGTNEGVVSNLMLQDSGVQINGESVPVNDLFRPVHDFFGHVKDNHQFGPRGEFNAWSAHSGMYSPEAQGALAAETLGQNAWVNFGKQLRGEGGVIPKKGEPGYVPLADRKFGEQKNTVISPELIDRAMAQLSPSKDPRAVKSAAARSEESGKIFEGSAHWEAYDAASAARDDNVLTDGFVTNEGEFLDRNQAYERALELKQIAAHTQMTQSPTTGNLESAVFKQNQAANTNRWRDRTVKESVDDVLTMSAPDFNQFMRDYKGVHASSATGIAIDIGRKAHGPEDILALKVGADIASERYKEARAAGDLDTAMAEAMRKQTFEEAVQAAERSRPAINELMSKFQMQAPKDEELAKIRSGETFGNTFLPNGEVWNRGDKKVDVVTLASTNVSREELTPDNFDKATAPYAEPLLHPDAVVGAFNFEKKKGPESSIDINVVVPQKFRENTKKFAAANQQISFWDAVEEKEVQTGGSGDTVLKTPEEISAAMENLVAGKPVQFQVNKKRDRDEPNEMWIGHNGVNEAPAGHQQWAADKFPVEGEQTGAHAAYERANNAGYLRAVVYKDALLVDRSTKYPTWESVPRAHKAAIEQTAIDLDMPVKFEGKEVIPQFKPGEGGAQMQAPKIPDDGKIEKALSTDKVPFIGAHRDLEEGTPIGVRIDIPAFTRNGEYVQTIHEAKTGGSVGKRIGYDGIVTIDDPVFFSNETGAEKIRAGAAKFPVATVEGNYNSSRKIPRDLKNWTEVGYNPREHSYFYEKGTDEMVVSGTKAVSVGNSVFVKDAVFGDKSTAQFSPAAPDKRRGGLPGFEFAESLSPGLLKNMTRKELAEHFPESVSPDKRDQKIPSDIVGSPLYKKAKGEAGAVEEFTKKMVESAREWENHPNYILGRKWYSEFTPLMKKEFGKDADLMAELLAATSPQTNAETNFGYAFDALTSLRDGRFDKIIPKFEEGLRMLDEGSWHTWYSEQLASGKAPVTSAEPTAAAFVAHWVNTHDLKPKQSNGSLYGTHSLPVLQVLARRWLTLNRGPKTLNFVKNLLGTGHEATIDLWADRTMRRLGYEGSKERWRILPENATGVSDADFAFAQKVFRAAAKQLGMRPDSLQGALWFAEKQHWANQGWSRLDLGDFRAEMEKIPLLKQGYKQRLATVEARAAGGKSEPQELDIVVEPREKKP